ncbi:MAG TPA: hypothetical protein VKH34_05195 [Vicinamibacterales bacterium]|nr:hypothetical protein [Vicinamibacterales bacterium]
MKKYAAVVVCLLIGSMGSVGVFACGDKFLLTGSRTVRYLRAYAAVRPARILLVIPPKSVKIAAVRDPRLKSALKAAGHSVDAVPAAKLAEALAASRYDIIMAERTEAVAIPGTLPAGPGRPSVIGVLEDAAGIDTGAPQLGLDRVLKTPQALPDILRMLDDVMAARRDRARASTF